MTDDTPADGHLAASPRTRTVVARGAVLAVGTRVAGRYRIEAKVGFGGMGIVYRALDEELGVTVALKVLRPDLAMTASGLERFRREVVLARQVSHPRVVRIHDLGQDDELLFMTMDFVPGRSLRELIEGGPLAIDRALEIARQLAQGLAAAHAQGVVHRDVKPGNVLIDDQGKAHLTDFGVARSASIAGLTGSGSVVGTLDYLSPEQARGEDVDSRSDLYALGIVLFEMVAGQLPFPAGSAAEVLARRASGRPRSLAEAGLGAAPAGLERLLALLLEPRRERRLQSGEAVVAALDAVAAGRVPAGGRRWRAGLAGGLLLALVVVVGWRVIATRPPAPAPVVEQAEAKHTLAVLPLRDETGSAALGWVSTGLAERIAGLLGEQPAIGVVGSLRVFGLVDDLGLPPRLASDRLATVAALLDADRLVVGTVRQLGEVVRIELELVGVDGRALGGQVAAEGPVSELYGVADRVAVELATRLEAPIVEPPPAAPTAPIEALAAYSAGVRALAQGEAVAALEPLERAVELAPDLAEGWLRLAVAYDAQGRPDEASDAAMRAVELTAGQSGRLALEARAQAATVGGDADRARTLLEELVARYPHDVGLRLSLAETLGEAGALDQARTALRALLEDSPSLARAWFLLAKYTILGGDSRSAVDDLLVRALVLQNRLGNLQGKGDVLNAMGLAYERLGQLDQAAEHYRQAAAIREQIGDRRGFAITLRNLAAVHAVRGEDQAAVDNLDRARSLLEELGDQAGLAELYEVYGVFAEERSRYREALEHYRRSLALRQELGDPVALADSYNNLGFAYSMLGEYDNAGVYWRQAFDLREQTGDRRGVVLARQSLGMLALAQGRWQDALGSFLGALEQARALDMPPAIAVSLVHLGRVAALQGRYADALRSFEEALAALERLDDRRGWVEASLWRAEALAELGAAAAARAALGAVDQALVEAPNPEHALRRALIEVALGSEDGRTELPLPASAPDPPVAAGSRELELRVAVTRAGANGLDALLALEQEIAVLGNASLELGWRLEVARAAWSEGRPDTASSQIASLQRRLRAVGSWSRTWEVHTLELALGRSAAGPALAIELERVTRGLEPGLEESFLARARRLRESPEGPTR